jgi:hypothetical protein
MLDINFDRAANVRKTVAVEFNERSVRILQFRKHGNDGYTLRSFLELKLSKGSNIDGVIQDPKVVGNAIMRYLPQAKPAAPDTSYAICVIPQQYIFFMSLDIPSVSEDEVGKVVENKVSDLIPMAVEDVYWDWRVIGKNKNKLQVQLAAVPRRIIDSYMQTLEEAKLIPLLFEPSAEAASRVGRANEGDETLILVELSQLSAIISISKGENILFSTDMPLGLGAETGIHTKQLLAKIEELIVYTDSGDGKERQNARIRLYGEPKIVESVLQSLQKVDTPYNISRIKYQHSADNSISQLLPEEVLDGYVALIGSGIRGLPGYSSQQVTLNLVPQEAKRAFTKRELAGILRKYLSFIALDVGIIIVALALVQGQTWATVETLNERYKTIQTVTESQRVKQLESAITELNSDSLKVIDIQDKLYNWEKVLDVLNKTTPAGITISGFSVLPPQAVLSGPVGTHYNVTISGAFTAREQLIEFVDALRAEGMLTEIKLPVSSFEGGQLGQFTLEARLAISLLLNGDR